MWNGPLLTTTGAVWLHLSSYTYLQRSRRASTDRNFLSHLRLILARLRFACHHGWEPNPPLLRCRNLSGSKSFFASAIMMQLLCFLTGLLNDRNTRLYQALSKQLTLAVLTRHLAFLFSSNLISSPTFRLPNHHSLLSRIYPAIPSSLTRCTT